MEENNQNNVATTPVVENVQGTTPVVNQPKKKKNILPIILIVIAILFLVFLIVYFLFFAPVKNKTELDLSLKEQENAITGYGQALESAIDIQYNIDKKVLTIDEAKERVHNDNNVKCTTEGVNEDRTVYLSGCSIKNYPVKYTYGIKREKPKISTETSFIVYYDESSKKASLEKFAGAKEMIINTNGKYSKPELLSDYSNILSYVKWWDEKYKYHVTNYLTGKEVLEGVDYTECNPIKNGNTYTQYAFVTINDKTGIYNYVNGSMVVNPEYRNDAGDSVIFNDYIQLFKDGLYYLINYKTGDKVLSSTFYFTTSGNYIVTSEYNSSTNEAKGRIIYDIYFNRVFDDFFDELLDFVDGNYVVGIKNNHIILKNTNGTVLNDYGEVSDNASYFFGTKYQDGLVFQFRNKETKKCVEYIYSISNGADIKDTECASVAKPILYFYPKKDINVKVTFDDPSVLETTYPKYNNGWEVLAKKDGSLYDKKGKYYYALYWDEEKIHTTDFKEGFYVTKDNAIDFLEEKLDIIGLNEKERNEFIMYWLPILEKNKNSLVYFELTDERNSYSKININPKPDSMLRIVIHIKKVNKKTNIKEEKLVPFERNGFTVVEWGGTTY